MSKRFQVSVSHIKQQMIQHALIVNFTYSGRPLSTKTKSLSIYNYIKQNICHSMFKDTVTCTFMGIRWIKPYCNILIVKPEKMCLFRNTQLLQGLDTVGTHVKHGSNHQQSCFMAVIKNLHNKKHLLLSASMNQIEIYWLLPRFM